MIGQKADVIFQVAGLSGAGAIEAACAAPGVIGIGVDVDQSKSLPQSAKCILTSAEKKLVSAVEAAIKKLGAKTDVGGTTVWDASTDPVGVGLSPFQGDYVSLVTPAIQSDRRRPGRDEGRHDRSVQADRLRQERLTRGRVRTDSARTGRHHVGPFVHPIHRPQPRGNEMVDAGPILEMRGITKRYPGVVANDKIDLDLRPGEIHALLGENGAGKSTLMNILYGLAVPDEGEILIDGQPVEILGPHDAIDRGISMVHQHFMLVPVLTVAENILLGEETMANAIFIDRNEARRRIVALGRQFGFEIDPDARIENLSVGWQQRVEILKALYRKARILVLDEPTAVLTPRRPRRSSPSCAGWRPRATRSSSSATSSTRSSRSPIGSRSSGAAGSSVSASRAKRTRRTWPS